MLFTVTSYVNMQQRLGLLIFIIIIFICEIHCKQPHIVFIIADDLGWNDVSMHGSNEIPTPNIDALGYNGIILHKHYTMHICTPSRTALLTGNYPMRAGMQGFPLSAGEPRALPINMATIAEKLSELGYRTHMVGKWHLGHQNRSVTPVGRGFHTFLGYWNGWIGYFDYKIHERNNFEGFDLHRDFSPAFNLSGTYATDLFTSEAESIIKNHNKREPLFLVIKHLAAHSGKDSQLEVPDVEEAMTKYDYIDEPQRRLYADIVNRLDSSVGKVVTALEKENMLENTILVFMSDNGAQTIGLYNNYGSNWPLRGLKFTLYEGGVRNVAAIWAKNLRKKKFVEKNVFHITDWMPTLYAAAGGDIANLGKIDGINNWPLLFSRKRNSESSARSDILLNIDEVADYSAILSSDGRYKLSRGTFQEGIYDNYFGNSGREISVPAYNITAVLKSAVNKAIQKCDRTLKPLSELDIINIRSRLEIKQFNGDRGNISCLNDYCLFDLQHDPTETINVAKDNPRIVEGLKKSLNLYRTQLVPQTNKPVDPNSNPAYCNWLVGWFPWLDPVIRCEL